MIHLQKKITLNGKDWYLHEDTAGTDAEQIGAQTQGWIEACVPGNIQWDMENAKMLFPLWYGNGDDRLLDICRKDWWYRKELVIPREFQGRRLTLRFWGVDYSCNVYINGKHAGANQGMFCRFDLDITDLVSWGEKNILSVKVDRMPPELLEWLVNSDGSMSGENTPYFFVFANNKIRQTLKGLKSPANCSYDWGTNIYTLGIWKDVELCVSGDARIDWMQAKAVLAEDFRTAQVTSSAEIYSYEEQEADVVFTVAETGQECTVRARLKKGSNRISASIEIDNPRLWWVTGYGAQEMYQISVRILCEDTLLDEDHIRFGIRQVSWQCCQGVDEDFPNKFRLVLNGKAIRTMGSNFVVPDLLYARAEKKYRHFVEMARECNMNTLRQHGGQVVFSHDFYDAADELGILLLVDFPIGNCVPENEPEFLKNFSHTVKNIVKQLRNHPSIIEWSGGNELDWYFNPTADHTALKIEEEAVYSQDDSRLFRATCPISGSRHAPWDYNREVTYRQFNKEIKDNFGKVPMMRYGEFGCQTPSNIETWYRDVPVASQWPIREEDSVLVRKNAVNAVFGSDFWLCKGRIEELFGPMEDLETLIRAGQFVGAEGVRYMMDALRAKGERVGGFTSWDYNEPWPNCAGSYMIDYDGRPVMMYHFVKQALSPLSLQLKYDDILYDFYEDTWAELQLVSDLPESSGEVIWKWTARDRFGKQFGSGTGKTRIQPWEVQSLDRIRINPPENMMFGPAVVELQLTSENGSILSERLHVFGAKGAEAPLRGLLKQDMKNHEYGAAYVTTGMAGGKITQTRLELAEYHFSGNGMEECLTMVLENKGEMTGFFVEIHPVREYRTDLVIRGNFTFIPPGEKRTIRVLAAKRAGSTLKQLGFTIKCWNGNDLTIAADESVLLTMGRKDSTCREYKGYFEEKTKAAGAKKVPSDTPACESLRITADHGCIHPENVPYLMEGSMTMQFEVSREIQEKQAVLRIHTCDRDKAGVGSAVIVINGKELRKSLPAGLGEQKKNPQQLAYPETLEFKLEKGILKQGSNILEVRTDFGWFTWDALELTAE